MKKTMILMGLFICSSSILFAQARNHPPQEVQQAFHNDRPDAKNENWHQTKNQWHERHMQPNTKLYEDNYYDRKGTHIDTHRQIVRTEIPVEVDKHFRSHYHGYKNYHAVRIERPSQPALFQISFTIGAKNRTIYTDEQGNEVKYVDRH